MDVGDERFLFAALDVKRRGKGDHKEKPNPHRMSEPGQPTERGARRVLAYLDSSVPLTPPPLRFLFRLPTPESSSSSFAAASFSIVTISPLSRASSYAASLLFRVFRRFGIAEDLEGGDGEREEERERERLEVGAVLE